MMTVIPPRATRSVATRYAHNDGRQDVVRDEAAPRRTTLGWAVGAANREEGS